MLGLWEMPFFRSDNWAARLLGGWQLSGFMILQSGSPMTVTRGGSFPNGDFNGDNTGGDRPNAPADSVQKSGWTREEFLTGIFQVADFPRPPQGVNGNLGRKTYIGPGFAEVNLSLMKKFLITERASMTLQLDSFNAFNRVNLTNPVLDLNNNAFGRSTGTYSPRLYQLGLKFAF
jgi:hypothetical protein